MQSSQGVSVVAAWAHQNRKSKVYEGNLSPLFNTASIGIDNDNNVSSRLL